MAAHHQHTGAPEQIAAHVDAVLVLLRHRVIEEQRQIEHRADGGIARIVDHAAVMRRLLHIHRRITAPRSGDISKGSFHLQHLRYLIGSSTLSPRPFPFMGKGGSGGYTPAAVPEIAQPGQAVKGKPPQTAGVPPLDGPFPAALQNIRRRGIYHHRAHPRRGAFTSGQSVQKRGPVTSPSPFSCPAAPVRAAVSLSTRPAAP